MKFSIAICAAALVTAAGPATASAQGIAGTWETRVPRFSTNEGGTVSESGFIPVTIHLEQRGDSVFGTWERGAVEGLPAGTPLKLRGVVHDSVVVLATEPLDAVVDRNGTESKIQLTRVYNLIFRSDELTGSESSQSSDGEHLSDDRAFKATRRKS